MYENKIRMLCKILLLLLLLLKRSINMRVYFMLDSHAFPFSQSKHTLLLLFIDTYYNNYCLSINNFIFSLFSLETEDRISLKLSNIEKKKKQNGILNGCMVTEYGSFRLCQQHIPFIFYVFLGENAIFFDSLQKSV